MELPKRARTADWENGVLTLDGEKKFEIPELTMELMERLAGYSLVGFHVKDYPATDELLIPFAGHKSMANFGVENGSLTDACFPIFDPMPKLRYLLLDGNSAIHGSGLSALHGSKLDLLTLNRTGLDDAGLLQAASIPKLSHIQIDHTAVTYNGLLAIAGNNRIEPVAHVQFTKEQMEHFSQLQREKAKKPVHLDEQAAEECRSVLSAFFAEMTEWEQYMEQAGFEDAEAVPRLLAIWEKYVSEKPRPGYRPLGLSYSAQGTYNGEEFLDAEQITKNKLYIYTREKNTGFDRRFLMKRVGEGWKIDAVQERLNGWQRTEL
ncbi:MAG: NTF2 fold immunity protein [Clostridium sp.]